MVIQRQRHPIIDYDREADAVYIQLRDAPYERGEDLDGARRIDYGADGRPIGVEVLNVSLGVKTSHLPDEREIAQLLAANGIKTY
jgi:uncharacterized protein YuzE